MSMYRLPELTPPKVRKGILQPTRAEILLLFRNKIKVNLPKKLVEAMLYPCAEIAESLIDTVYANNYRREMHIQKRRRMAGSVEGISISKYYCRECGYRSLVDSFAFCPHCGVRIVWIKQFETKRKREPIKQL